MRYDDNVFQRDGQLVTVIRPTKSEDEDPKLGDEAPQIRKLTAGALLPRLTDAAYWVRLDKEGGTIQVKPPKDVVSGVLEAGEYPGIPKIVGISETPVVDTSLQICQAAGFDADTGVYYWPNAEYALILRPPTREDAEEAYERLIEPISEFPFEPLELGRAVYVAAILTVLARHAIIGSTPLFLIQKNVRGAGATLLADAIAVITTGRAAGRMTLPEDLAEQEKVLASFGLAGRQLICFDNVTHLGGGPIDKCITAVNTVDLRVLGENRIASVPWRSTMLVTGNNVAIEGDTTRRTLCATLCALEERPELRSGWKHHPLLEYLAKNRVEIVHDALTLIAAYRIAGRPDLGVKPLGSFEAWTAVVANTIVFAGGANPIEAYAEAQGVVDAKRDAIGTLLAQWHLLPGAASGLTVKQLLATLYPHQGWREAPPPDDLDDLREAVEALAPAQPGKLPSARTLGKELATVRRRVIGGLMLDGTKGKGAVMRWRVVRPKGGSGGLGGSVANPIEKRNDVFKNNMSSDPTHPIHPTHPDEREELFNDWVKAEVAQ